MKLYDKETKECIANVLTNHSMSIDEVLKLMNYEVNEDGQIYDKIHGNELSAWYVNLEMDYDTPWDD